MLCPSCKADNGAGTERCASCGASLTDAAKTPPGKVISGRYEILELLGAGGMGAVFKAHDRALDETIAIKVLRTSGGVTRDMDRRFRAEIKLARKISHKNVCRIHEYGEDGELRYLSMALVQGVDLKRIITQKGGLPPEEAFDVALQVAEGLQAIHDEGIAHRDLKTPNIMRDERGIVRLMDFGIAKQWTGDLTGSHTATGMVVGTPEYMSPEQVRGEKVDGRTDIYALGIVLYEVFTGHVPFRADTPVGTLWQQLKEPPPLDGPDAARIPAPVVPILRKALAKEPDQRYASARGMADDLRRARDRVLTSGEIVPSPARDSAVAPQNAPITQTTPWPCTPAPRKQGVEKAARPQRHRTAARTVLLAFPVFVVAAVAAGVLVRHYLSSRQAAPDTVTSDTAAPPVTNAPTPVVSAPPTVPNDASTPPVTSAPSPSGPRTSRLAAPVPLAPADGAEIPAGMWPRLTWDPVPGASSYRAVVALDPSFRSPHVDRRQSQTGFDVGELSAGLRPGESRRYYWRVAALDKRDTEGAFSVGRRFTIAKPPLETSRAQPTPAAGSAQGSGILQLTVIPWAEVTIDGAPVQSVPLRKISLPPGPHVVRLLHPDYEPVQRKVTIRSGEKLDLTVDLPEEAVPKKR